MSVTLAPRARIAVNASWPGVSRKVITPAACLDVIGADVLRDAAGFAAGDAGAADVVEQRGLAVVDVAHHGDHRRRGRFSAGVDCALLDRQEGIRVVELGGDGLVAHFLDHDHRRFLVEHLVDGDHLPSFISVLDDLGRLHRHLVRQVGDGDGFGHQHFPVAAELPLPERRLQAFQARHRA
jgi:hypothetical protein